MVRSSFSCDHYLDSASGQKIEESHLLTRQAMLKTEKLYAAIDGAEESLQTLKALRGMTQQQ